MAADWWNQVKLAVIKYDGRRKRKRKGETLAPAELREMEAVERALKWMKAREDGAVKAKLIQMYYIKQTHTMEGAAYQVGYSRRAAYYIASEFMKQVARELGYL